MNRALPGATSDHRTSCDSLRQCAGAMEHLHIGPTEGRTQIDRCTENWPRPPSPKSHLFASGRQSLAVPRSAVRRHLTQSPTIARDGECSRRALPPSGRGRRPGSAQLGHERCRRYRTATGIRFTITQLGCTSAAHMLPDQPGEGQCSPRPRHRPPAPECVEAAAQLGPNMTRSRDVVSEDRAAQSRTGHWRLAS